MAHEPGHDHHVIVERIRLRTKILYEMNGMCIGSSMLGARTPFKDQGVDSI
jgi:hypothetical protein